MRLKGVKEKYGNDFFLYGISGDGFKRSEANKIREGRKHKDFLLTDDDEAAELAAMPVLEILEPQSEFAEEFLMMAGQWMMIITRRHF
ncbi:MAG: hypothetical protein KJ893_04500 [Candidatus Omnitrophica bacterium]|nr:hypothetical protein [Candidatus Omnitrophota bacterium]MCG2704315.1 hypothetical protein [Candidatus Omnitrophota bacterium]